MTVETLSENMHEKLLRELYEIETHTTPRDLAMQQERRDNLARLVTQRQFIGSLWAYGLEEGQEPHEASILWMPYEWSADSGRRSVLIKEFETVDAEVPKRAKGSEELEQRGELLFGIFEHMVTRGTVQLVLQPQPPEANDKYDK